MNDRDVTGCEDKILLIQADHDGELDAGSAASLASHVAGCPTCARVVADLSSLSKRLRAEVGREPAPDQLRLAWTPDVSGATVIRPRAFRRVPLAFFGGAALAACVTLFMLPRTGGRDDPTALLLAAHARALQPGHLLDVTSSDQHTVKPWFNGRIDYSPPAKDLAVDGFPLIGGRLDSFGHGPVAVLVYRHDKHLIDVFVQPGGAPEGHEATMRDGFNIVGWREDGMEFRAVSDLNARELDGFAQFFRSAP